jgi:germination protein M
MTYLTNSSRFALFFALVLSAMVILAACDDGDDDEQPAEDTTAPTVEVSDDTGDADDDSDQMPIETPEPATDDTVEDSEPAPEEDENDTNGEQPQVTPETDQSDAEEPAPVPSHDEVDDETGASPRAVLAYVVRNEEIATVSREIAGTPEVATGAMNELLTGLTPYENDLGLSTAIPAETRLLGLAIQDDGTAVVDLSPEFEAGGGSFSMQMRVAQVVFTLTQFDTVDQVQIQIDGQDVEAIGGEGVLVDQPLNRDDFEDLSPAILLEHPTPGTVVSSPLELRGTSNTFEANLQIEIIDASGEVIYRDFATATSGTGTRGTFHETIELDLQTEGLGTIVMFEESAQDGSRINIIEVPVDFRH